MTATPHDGRQLVAAIGRLKLATRQLELALEHGRTDLDIELRALYALRYMSEAQTHAGRLARRKARQRERAPTDACPYCAPDERCYLHLET